MTFVKVDDLANIWCEYVEFELRNRFESVLSGALSICSSDYTGAVRLLRRATALPPKRGNYFDDTEKVQFRVYRYALNSTVVSPQWKTFRSLRIWSLYADIEESMGTVESCKAVYERILDLRIATPQIVINYAMFLEDNKYFEDAFKVATREKRTTIVPCF